MDKFLPFGVHLGPRMQSGAARPLGQVPIISLFRPRVSATTTKPKISKVTTSHSPSENQVDRGMSTLTNKNQ